ncbi:MAG: polyphenol oxidase family protein [Treponema sp.]|nr:polyphenol oxidase family protein [Treponema sp.]
MLQPTDNKKFEFYKFRRNGKIVDDSPVCGLTLKAAGSMRFRWNEKNERRDLVLNPLGTIVPLQLDHTHIVYNVKEAGDTKGKIGDGIITKNELLVPSVTVADCMPVYLYDSETGVFGIVHSGWKGTGIAVDAIKLAQKEYGARAENFLVILGPHIRECCYIVSQERADYFSKNFTPECIKPLESGVEVSWNTGSGALYRLSLEKANLAALKKAGVPDENIWIHPACTCCTQKDNTFIYGSNRRETTVAGQPDKFTVQAAFICCKFDD